jgi:hypothetical protein
MTDTNVQVARQIQLKYEFYLLSLCFTVLALAVETAKFGGPIAANVTELLSWLCLLISGLIGLFRFHLVPSLYQISAEQARMQHDKSLVQEQALRGTNELFIPEENKNVKISDLVTRIDTDLARVNDIISEQNNTIITRYLLHQWLFVAGVVALVISRGYEPAARILQVLFCKLS